MQYFLVSILFALVALPVAYVWGGFGGLTICFLLMLMEITLSFDNAVVNAGVLKEMEVKWRRRFLTWGILIAVFGIRFIFPIVIVAFATHLHIWDVTRLAFENPTEYSEHVAAAHVQIGAFGGMFLVMVFFHFMFNEAKELHWLKGFERHLVKIGKLESIEIALALLLLLGVMQLLPEAQKFHALVAGTVGVILHVALSSISAVMGKDGNLSAISTGLMGFIYLQVLDASFSLDGVIGAFAMSQDVVIIMLGLGVGALFVRSLTVYMVHKGTLDRYIYLEHGAHYGIGALAAIMLLSMVMHVPEIVTGLIGLAFVTGAFISSVRYNKRLAKAQ